MGTGTIELKSFKRQEVDPGYRKKLDDFVRAITPGEPICKPHERMMYQDRLVVLTNLYNIFSELMRGYNNLARWQDRKAILERIYELEKEATFCNRLLSDKKDFSKIIRDLAEEYISKDDWKKFREEQRQEKEGK